MKISMDELAHLKRAFRKSTAAGHRMLDTLIVKAAGEEDLQGQRFVFLLDQTDDMKSGSKNRECT